MRACLMACPYGAITSNPRAKGSISYYPGTLTLYEAWGYGRHSPGAALKCNFCLHRVEKGLLPACVQTCPTDARIFGDLDDPTSKVARLIRERPHMRLLEEKGTNPSVYYVF
jgi:molybdopterin-containing oxidoreductase family iron-sulfur binding subunit